MTFPSRRRIIDLCAHDTGLQTGCCASAEIDELKEQIARDRAEMSEEIARLRRQFSFDLSAVAAELRATKAELHRLQLINEFANAEHRDLSAALH